jgi:ABC-type phosphate transport system substrate-binding protein
MRIECNMDSCKVAALMYVYVLTNSLVVRAEQRANLRGAGSSMPYEVYRTWIAGYKTHREQFQKLNIVYESVGSLDAKSWKGNATERIYDIEYASVTGKDAVLSEEDYQRFPDLQIFPTVAG